MKRRSRGLRTRIVVAYMLLTAVSDGVLLVVAGRAQAATHIADAERILENQAVTISNALENIMEEYADNQPGNVDTVEEQMPGEPPGGITLADLQARVADLVPSPGVGLAVLLPDGSPLYHSLASPGDVPNQASEPEVSFALAQRTIQHDIRLDPISGQQRLFVAATIEHLGTIYGVVQLSEPTVELQRSVNKGWLSLGMMAVAVAALSVAIGLWIANQLLSPLEDLRRASNQIAQGDLRQRAPVHSRDELGEVAVAFNGMIDRVERTLTRQKMFVANASHELRTPLTNIKLRGEALLDGALDDPSVARRFVSDMVDETARLARIVQDLITLSQLDRRHALSQKTMVDLNALWTDTLHKWEPAFQERDVRCLTQYGHLPQVLADTDEMVEIFDNLLSNSLKFTPPEGQIALRTWAEDGFACFSVTDTGPGIPPDDLPYVFERFYQGSNSATGTGLGLSIVRSIVEAQNGTIELASPPGAGVTATVRLPVADETSQ